MNKKAVVSFSGRIGVVFVVYRSNGQHDSFQPITCT